MRMRAIMGILAGVFVPAVVIAQAPSHSRPPGHETRVIKPRDGRFRTRRVYTALGDSIVAGYCGRSCRLDSYGVWHARAAANLLDAKVHYRGRAHSGALMDEIADDVASHTRDIAASDFVVIEGCGNDYLVARNAYRNQADCTDETVVVDAVDACQAHMARALDTIAANKEPGASVYVMNLYYPGVDTDKGQWCGSRSHFEVFLDHLVASNWATCNQALARGFACVDAFAAFHAPDFDTDGNGLAESDEIRFDPATDLGNFEAYYERVVLQNRDILADANHKRLSARRAVDYLQPDDVHPSRAGHRRLAREHLALGF